MGTSLFVFFVQFGYGNEADRVNTNLPRLLASSFYLTFLILFALLWVCLQIACISDSSFINGLLLSGAFVFYLFATYSFQGSLVLKLCLAIALLLTAGLRINSPANGIFSFFLFFMIIRSPLSRSYFGQSLIQLPGPVLTFSEVWTFSVILFIVSSGSVAVRAFAKSTLHNREIVEHLNTSISQISKINQELQDNARKAGEEAASLERNRISRDIHDISGYIFTNIISLMDAGMSTGRQSQDKIEEIFQTARAQAKDGLQETRRALHALRDGGYSGPKGINAIYRIKEVFQNITGVEIQIDSGNIPNHFTNDIDRMMYCTVQEALTNSRRHGMATRIRISFWLNENILLITVTDNGIGAKQIVKGIGFAGMEERLAPFGGTIDTSNPIEGGFRLSIKLPIPKNIEGEKSDGNR